MGVVPAREWGQETMGCLVTPGWEVNVSMARKEANSGEGQERLEALKRVLALPPETVGREPGSDVHDVSGADVEKMLLASSIRELLKKARAHRSVSGAQLGEQLGMSKQRVSQIEQAETALELQTLSKYLDALGYELRLEVRPQEGGAAIVVDL